MPSPSPRNCWPCPTGRLPWCSPTTPWPSAASVLPSAPDSGCRGRVGGGVRQSAARPLAAPRLTTVDQQVQRVGAAAARALLVQCGEDVLPPALDGRPRLVVRESTGPLPSAS
ncbi:substrate-binding domain-containing protein [Streptomyces sp. M10(2022)]